MNTSLKKVAGVVRAFLYLLLLTILLPETGSAQIGIQVPQPPQVIELFQPTAFGLEYYQQDSTFLFKKPSIYKRAVEMDSTSKYVSFKEGIDNTQFVLPAVVDLDTYVRLRMQFDSRELFKKSTITMLSGQQEQSSGAIELDIPFRIKSRTFTRIFGSDRIGLRVTGNISFDLSGRTEERSGSAVSAVQSQNTFSPRFKQTQQFTVEGKIGDKVTVSVEQNSEATVDIENTLKLTYTGEEDEIVQKIEAGNISLSLPSTKYVMFGGSNQGLFGLKTQMQMGNLYFTAIASLEKGQQQELTISGGSQESTTTINDYSFIKNRFFFADTFYRDTFEDGLKDNPSILTYEANKEILQLEVWQTESRDKAGVRHGLAVIDPTEYWNSANGYKDVVVDDFDEVEGEIDPGYYIQLEEGSDYEFDPYRGYIKLSQPIDNSKALAIAYTTLETSQNDGLPTVGTMSDVLADTTDPTPLVLRLIKPIGMTEDNDKVWSLMMRNVYSLGGSSIESDGFELKLMNNAVGDQRLKPAEGDYTNRTYLNLLGLDYLDENGGTVEGGDEIVDVNPYTINLSDGLLMFPALKPFKPDKGSRFDGLIPESEQVDMYDITPNQSDLVEKHQFEMQVTSKSTRSTFDLGFYVLEGSEVVTAGGATLVRDKDYTIDYFSGQLTLVSNEALRSSSELQVKYERANLFQLDKKTIFGGRMEYRFWDDSFIGLTALYLNKTTLDQRVRVGQEPFSNFVWDINAALKFKPRFITKAINALPIVETNTDSKVAIEGEFAQVLPNPNSLNNEKTGDDDGVAYIDDFESSKRTTTLGIRYRAWSQASPPEEFPNLDYAKVDPQTADKTKQRMAWFNPYNQTLIQDIWPEKDVNSQTGQTTDVLGIDLMRDPDVDPDSAWAGIMRSTLSFADQNKTKYIEMWVKGYTGTMHIDIGRISEDWYVKEYTYNYWGQQSYTKLNSEDFNINGLLEENEDVGIDGVEDGDPDDDPYDNWKEPFKDDAITIGDGYNYDYINGTEGNSNSRDARYPDTEDLDGDGDVSTINSYFEYTLSLEEDDLDAKEWIKGSTEQGWRLFRIPLKDWTHKVNEPDTNFQQIYSVRLWFSDLPEERTRIRIATFDFVGNEWEEKGIADHRDSSFVKNDDLFTLATYNTEENAVEIENGPEPYTSPPGVEGVKDRITQAVSKEQSLVMIINELKAGQYAEAKKILYNSMELVNYKNLKMFVHGDRSLPEDPPVVSTVGDTMTESSWLRFYMRFGADANNFYEYGQDIYAGWHESNNIDIDLDELAAVKSEIEYDQSQGDTTLFIRHFNDDVNSYYMAQGAPSLKTIRYFNVGIYHKGNEMSAVTDDFKGEVWLDEMRLSNVRREKATAMRIATNVALADVITFSAQWESKEADFHNISTQFGSGDTQEKQSYRGKIVLDKFLPESWDLSIPIDGNISLSRSIPKYKPKSDELTGYSNDTFTKKVQSLFGIRDISPELDEIASKSEVFGWGTTIKTRTKSKRWYLRYTIDEMVFDFDYSKKNSSNWQTLFNRSEQYKESFQYKIPFGKDNYVQPFTFLKNVPVLKKINDQKVYYTPNNISTSINIVDSETEKLQRAEGSELTRTVSTTTTRQISANYNLIPSMKFSYGRNHKTDADFIGLKHENLLEQIITKGNFGLETGVTQSFSGDFKPKIVDWFKPDYSYDNSFNYSRDNGYQRQNVSNKTTHKVGLNISPGKLLKAIYTPGGKKKSSSGSGRSRRRRSNNNQNKDNKKTDEKSESSFPNPLMLIYDMFAGWNNVKTTVSQSATNKHQTLESMPSWGYQFGFTNDPGVEQDSTLGIALVGPSLQDNLSVRTSTSLDLTSYVKATLSHDFTTQESSTDNKKTRSGSRSTSYFSMDDDPLENPNGLGSLNAFVPDWNVSVNKIEKLLFFDKFAKSISLEHGHSSKYTEKLKLNTTDQSFGPNSSTYSNNWQPLIGVNIRTKWDVNATARMTKSASFSKSKAGAATKSETEQMSVNLTYKTSGGFKVPIPVWPFKGKTFKNEINMNLAFDMSSNNSFQKQYEQKKYQATQKNSTWKLRPSATYRFSSRVQGSLFYERGTTKNKVTGTYSYNEFGITVNIAIHD